MEMNIYTPHSSGKNRCIHILCLFQHKDERERKARENGESGAEKKETTANNNKSFSQQFELFVLQQIT